MPLMLLIPVTGIRCLPILWQSTMEEKRQTANQVREKGIKRGRIVDKQSSLCGCASIRRPLLTAPCRPGEGMRKEER